MLTVLQGVSAHTCRFNRYHHHMSKIAICIPTYNQAAHLRAAVESAFAQTIPCEVWVADDASTDDTPRVLQALQSVHAGLHVFRHERNLGIAGNPGWIMRQPDAEFILRLDSDDTLAPQYVETLVGALQRHPQAGCAHAAVEEIDHDGKMRRVRRLHRTREFESAEACLAAGDRGYRVAANICLFRRRALESVDFIAPLGFAEDWDLYLRLADAGWGNVYESSVLAKYRVWDDVRMVTASRRIAEIAGVRHVLGTTLVAAYARRGWSTDRLRNARVRAACQLAASLRDAHDSAADLTALRNELIALGGGRRLDIEMALLRSPLGKLLLQYRRSRRWAVDLLKSTLAAQRSARDPAATPSLAS